MKAARVNKMMELISGALVSLSKDSNSNNRDPRIFITVEQASSDPALMSAIFSQIDKSSLHEEYSGFFVAGVDYNRTTYIISGTHERWLDFFSIDISSTEKISSNRN